MSATTKNYYSYIFDALVNGNAANSYWTGGSYLTQDLGNLSAGTTEFDMDRLIAKWFGGTDRPLNYVGGDAAAGLDQNGLLYFDYAASSGLLFEDYYTGPTFDDINQGTAGTCYLLAAAAALCVSNRNVVRDMFIDNGDDTYGVRFFGSDGNQIWVTVDNQIPYNLDYGENSRYLAGGDNTWDINADNLWVALLEKAYAQANEIGAFDRGYVLAEDSNGGLYPTDVLMDGVNSYQMIEGGMNEAISHISGWDMESWSDINYDFTKGYDNNIGYSDLTYYSETDWLILGNILKSAFNDGEALFIGNFAAQYGGSGFDQQTLIDGHAYAVIDVYEDDYSGELIFELLNPWGPNTTSDDDYLHTFDVEWSDMKFPWTYYGVHISSTLEFLD